MRKTNNKGFTLLEVLVVTGIIGILFVVSSQIFINTIRSANKANITNEARENASLVSESLERDIHRASGVVVPLPPGSGTSLELSYSDGSENIIWVCKLGGFITRQVGAAGIAFTVTNRDTSNGVNVSSCGFTTVGGTSTLVTLNFDMIQGSAAGGSQDLQALVTQKVVASTRGY